MGRFVKNYRIRTGGYSVLIPEGTTSTRPANPNNGQLRFNTEIDKVELWSAATSSWRTFGVEGHVAIIKDVFIGDGISVGDGLSPSEITADAPSFLMSKSYPTGEESRIFVFVGNVFQEPGIAYTVDLDMLMFTSAPPLGSRIVVLHNFDNTTDAQ